MSSIRHPPTSHSPALPACSEDSTGGGNCLRGATVFIDRLFPFVRLLEPPPREDHWGISRRTRDVPPESVKEYLEAIQLGHRRCEHLKKLPRMDARAGQATAAVW